LTAIIDSHLVGALQQLGVSHASVSGDLQPLLVVLLGVLLCEPRHFLTAVPFVRERTQWD